MYSKNQKNKSKKHEVDYNAVEIVNNTGFRVADLKSYVEHEDFIDNLEKIYKIKIEKNKF